MQNRPRTIVETLRSHWRDKLVTALGTGLVMGIVFRTLQRLPYDEVTMRDDCVSWDWLPFSHLWFWPYVSMFALVGLAWLSLRGQAEIKRFSLAMLGSAAVAWVFFIGWPTQCSRPYFASPHWLYRLVTTVDAPLNCFPSLHASMSLLAAIVLTRPGAIFASAAGRAAIWTWTVLITLSIVATRQHTGVDVLAGWILGGAAAAWFALRRQQAGNAVAT